MAKMQSGKTFAPAAAVCPGPNGPVYPEHPAGVAVSKPWTKRTARNRSVANLLKMGHCAPTVMRTILDLNNSGRTRTDTEWLVKLTAGMPGGIGNTGFECGGVTSPLVLLGLRYGPGAMHDGLPLIFYKGHDFCQRFVRCNRTLLCNQILGQARLPIRCIGVICRSPELYAETVSSDGSDAVAGERREAYRHLYSHFVDTRFHCSHTVFHNLRQTIPVSQELLDGTSGFMGGTLFSGLTCSAFTAGVMALGLKIGEIEHSAFRVMRMITIMARGGNAVADDVNKFNKVVNLGKKMSRWFTQEFGSTQCRAITQCDFSSMADVRKYIERDCGARCRSIAERVAQEVQNVLEQAEAKPRTVGNVA